jgi:hypothetical protein
MVDYPIDKISCYVKDDGLAVLKHLNLHRNRSLPIKIYGVEPLAPEWYFQQST